MRIRFSKHYFALTLILLVVETCIAWLVDDAFVRPFVGDTLAVVLVYAAMRSGLDIARRKAALCAFALACAIELGQYFRLVELLGVADVPLARVVLGTYCDARDFAAYAAALPFIALAERLCHERA